MTTQQLMIPRVKCVIRYPCSPFPIGAILDQDFEEREMYNYTDSNERAWVLESPQLYPEVFEPLPWWKDRRVEDMPEYVRSIQQEYGYGVKVGRIIKVKEWVLISETMYVVQSPNREYHPSCFVPATKEEYEVYIKMKEGAE